MANLLVDWLNKGKNTVGNVGLKGIVGQNGVNVTGVNNKQSSTNATGNITAPVSNGYSTPITAATNSRFIGFQTPKQNQFQTPAPQGLSFGKLTSGQYNLVKSPVREAEINNAKEETRYRTMSEALMDLQGDLYKNQKEFNDAQLKYYYPEFKDNLAAVKELQKELLPIVKSGMGVDAAQLEQFYPELLKPKDIKDIEQVRKESEENNKRFDYLRKQTDKALRGNADALSVDGLKYLKGVDTMLKSLDQYKKQGNIGSSDYDILNDAIKNNPELQKLQEQMNSYKLSEKDKQILGKQYKTTFGTLMNQVWNAADSVFDFSHDKYNQQDIDNMINAKENLTGSEYWNSVKTNANAPINNIKKFMYGVREDFIGDMAKVGKQQMATVGPDGKLQYADNDFNKAMDQIKADTVQNKREYNDKVNAAFQKSIEKNLNPEVKAYYDSKSITELLAKGDVKGANYKMLEATAQNWQTIPEMIITAINPAVGLGIMSADAYAQSNQGIYEELTEMGVSEEEARTVAQIGGTAEAAVEVMLEKVLGGVEYGAASAFRRTFMKNVEKELVEKASKGVFKDVILKTGKEQLKESATEGLEEVVQTIIENAAKKTFNDDQALLEGVGEAFEGGFYNPMNAIGGGMSLVENANANQEQIGQQLYNGAEKVGQATRTLVDGVQNIAGNTRSLLQQKVANKGQQVQEQQQPTQQQEQPENTSWSTPQQSTLGKVVGGVMNAGNKVYDKVVDPVTDKVAEGITSTTTPQDKLFKAINPSLNVLTNKNTDYKSKRQSADRTNELIIEYGRTPETAAEAYTALIQTKQDVWNNGIQQGLEEHKYDTVDSKSITNAVRDELKLDSKITLQSNKSDLALLQKELSALDNMQELHLEEIEELKQQINAKLHRAKNPQAGEFYESGLRALNRQLSKIEDEIISKLPGQFSKFKRDYGALKNMEEDFLKMMLKDMKKKDNGIVENRGRLEGLTKIGGKNTLEGILQFFLGESLGKAKNTNFLIKSGYAGLREKYGNSGTPAGLDIKKNPPAPALEDKRTDVEKGKIAEIDRRTTRNKEEGYNKPKNAITGEKTAVTEKKTEDKKLDTKVEEKKQEPKTKSKVIEKNGKKIQQILVEGEVDVKDLALPPEGIDFMEYHLDGDTRFAIVDKEGNRYEVGYLDFDAVYEGLVNPGDKGLDSDVVEFLKIHDPFYKKYGAFLKKDYDREVRNANKIRSGEASDTFKRAHQFLVDFLNKKNQTEQKVEDKPVETPKNAITSQNTAATTQKTTTTEKKAATKKSKKTAKEELQDIVNKWKDVEFDNFDDEDSEGGGRNSKKFLNFAKELKKTFKTIADEDNLGFADYYVGYYHITAFFKDNSSDKYYYVSLGDVRDKDWWKGVLYRTARDTKDYTGGSNRYADLEELPKALKPNTEPTINIAQTSNKSTVTGEKTAITTRKVDNSGITGRFRNLTLEDYKEMQKFQGVEDRLVAGDEKGYIADIVKQKLLNVEDPLIEGAEVYEDELYPVNYDDFQKLIDKQQEIAEEERKLIKKNSENLSQEIEDLKYEFENEMLPNLGIYENEDANKSVMKIKKAMEEARSQFNKDKEAIKPLVEKYGKYWEQGKTKTEEKQATKNVATTNSAITENKSANVEEKKTEDNIPAWAKGMDETNVGNKYKYYSGMKSGWATRISEQGDGEYLISMGRGARYSEKIHSNEYDEQYLISDVKEGDVQKTINSIITGFGDKSKLIYWNYKPVKTDSTGVYYMEKEEGKDPEKRYLSYNIGNKSTNNSITAEKAAVTEKEAPKQESNIDTGGLQKQANNRSVAEKMTNVIVDIINSWGGLKDGYLKVDLKKEGIMPLSIEKISKDEMAISHTYIQNGDVMFDPEIVFKVDSEGKLMAKTIRQDGLPIGERSIRPDDSFIGTWAGNLKDYIKPSETNGEQDIDKPKQQNIIGKNNSLTSNNPTNERNRKDSGESSNGQKELSNSKQRVGSNEGGLKEVPMSVNTSGSESTLMSSGNSSSESGTRSEVGKSSSGIRTKGGNVITDKSVTQARDINRECVSILEKHDYSNNPNDYTAEEIETLKQYEGRGGVNDKKDSNTQGALNQYYTKDNIIKAMWRLVSGYNNTDIVEPSMGTGRFFMYAPEGSNLYGFEYDKIPGTIAQILYPNANIKIGDFQDNFMVGKFSMGENYTGKKYDLVIGNPPYEERQGRQRGLGEEPKITRFDDYFIKRGIDMLKPGGHLAFVTSSQFLRGADNYAKQMISKNARIVDAYRIPVGAFDRTGVETDIIVLEKTAEGGDNSLLSASKWFNEHPEKILGEERNDIQGRFGPKTAVVGDLAAIDEIGKANLGEDGTPAELKTTFTPNKETKKTTETNVESKQDVLSNGKNKITAKKQTKAKKEVDPNEWSTWTEQVSNDKGGLDTITWGKSLNGVIFKGLDGQKTGTLTVGDGGIGKYQNVLNANGKIGDEDITLESDREGLNYINGELEPNILYASGYIPGKLEQLEKDYKDGKINDRQYNKQKDLLQQKLPAEQQYQSIYWSPYAEWILDTETDSIKTQYVPGEGTVDKNQTVRQLFRDYVNERSKAFGTVTVKRKQNGREREEQASVADGIIKILDKQKIGPELQNEVVTKMPKAFNEFMQSDAIDDKTKVKLQEQFNRTYNGYANFDYSQLGYTVNDIAETFHGSKFNTSDVQARGIARILTTESMIIAHGVGQGKTIEGIIGAIASMQQGKAKKAIIVVPAGTKSSWMQTTAELFPNQEMVDLGSLSKGSGVRKKLVDLFGPDPRDWIQDGQLVFLEHSAVGKQISFKPDTLTLLQKGLKDKMESGFDEEQELISKQEQLQKEEDRNSSGNLSASQKEKSNKKIENLKGDIEKIGRSTDTLQAIIDRYSGKGLDVLGIQTAISEIDNDYEDYQKAMEDFINGNDAIVDKEKAKKLADTIFGNERAIYLEDLGIDHITVDEAHNFRNLFSKSLNDDEEGGGFHAGLNASEGSAEAKKLYGMTQYIMSQNGGGNVILLTATPFINNPSEIYNMLSYVGKNGMEEMGVVSMDDFYDQFVGLESKITPKASTSGVQYKNVMVRFNNTQALVKNLLDRYIDYEGESESIVKPRLNTHVMRLEMNDLQKEIQAKLEVQTDSKKFDDIGLDLVPLDKVRKTDDSGHELGAVIDGMEQAHLNLISPYLTKYLKPQLKTKTAQELIDSSPKLQMIVETIKEQRNNGLKRGIFVFMPDGKELHESLKEVIENAVPGIRVGIINGESKYKDLTETQAKKLGLGSGKGAKARLTGKQFHDGEIDILIGGDNTKEGLNLQGNGYSTLEVSQPRNFNDRIQLLGRIQRQGNLSNMVLDVLMLMENSSDIYRFELMSRKNSRWNILEQLSTYKKGGVVEDVEPQGELDLEEEKMALFTDPEKKAKVSIVMDTAKLKNEANQLEGQIDSMKKVIEIMSNWGRKYGTYKDFNTNSYSGWLDDRKGEDGKPITTNILDENALEPLEEEIKYHYDELFKEHQKWHPDFTKAQIEKEIRKDNRYSYAGSRYRSKREELSIARGDRNSVIRQTKALGIDTVEGLTAYVDELNGQLTNLKSKIKNIDNTLEERTAEFRRIKEQNESNQLSHEDILKDLSEEFKQQKTLSSKAELRNWLYATKDLPKREQARNKNDITSGKNKYKWNTDDYIGVQVDIPKPKNIVTSKYSEYSETNKKPEVRYIGHFKKNTIETFNGEKLTQIGDQDRFYDVYKDLLKAENSAAKLEHEQPYRYEKSEILAKDKHYQAKKNRLTGIITKFAKTYDEEIIKAYKKDHPGIQTAYEEDFYNYLNDYKVVEVEKKDKDGEITKTQQVQKISDEIVKNGAKYLADKFNGVENKTNILGNSRNKITSGM